MGARILVIDDYETIRKLLTCNLQIRGYQVFSYDYAHMDLTVLQQFNPDLIILDLNICNDGCGWGFLQTLKLQETTANIPILITTTLVHLPAEIQSAIFSGQEASLTQAFPSLVVGVLPKPFEVSHLLRAVEKYAKPVSRHARLSLNNHAVIRFDTRKKCHGIETMLDESSTQEWTIREGRQKTQVSSALQVTGVGTEVSDFRTQGES